MCKLDILDEVFIGQHCEPIKKMVYDHWKDTDVNIFTKEMMKIRELLLYIKRSSTYSFDTYKDPYDISLVIVFKHKHKNKTISLEIGEIHFKNQDKSKLTIALYDNDDDNNHLIKEDPYNLVTSMQNMWPEFWWLTSSDLYRLNLKYDIPLPHYRQVHNKAYDDYMAIFGEKHQRTDKALSRCPSFKRILAKCFFDTTKTNNGMRNTDVLNHLYYNYPSLRFEFGCMAKEFGIDIVLKGKCGQ
ncbi:TPA: hypothetical protein ACX6NV_002029 [Photobacterium damselae]